MGKKSIPVQPLFALLRHVRGAGGVAFSAGLLLLACSGKSEVETNGGAGQSGSSAAGRPSSAGGGATSSSGGAQATAGLDGRGGASGADANGSAARSGIISGAGRGGLLGRAGSGGGGNLTDTLLGSPCTTDTQCANGMVCATAKGTLLGDGGPSNGMCTMACTPGGTECDSLNAGAECFDFGTTAAPRGYCLDSCTLGAVADLNTKCAGRSDFVCTDLGDSTTPLPFCVPHCRSDAECGSGLYCDKSGLLGLCKITKPVGDPIGTACNPGTATVTAPKTCAAYCLRTSADGVTPPTGVCAELCSAGSECMYGIGANPTPGGFCGGAFSDSPGPIDLGYCLSNCSCSGECKFPGDLCRKWAATEADLESALGAPGVCYPTLAQSVELTTCTDGGAGAGGAGAGGASAGGASAGGAGAGGAGAGGASAGGASAGGAGTPPQTAGASGNGL